MKGGGSGGKYEVSIRNLTIFRCFICTVGRLNTVYYLFMVCGGNWCFWLPICTIFSHIWLVLIAILLALSCDLQIHLVSGTLLYIHIDTVLSILSSPDVNYKKTHHLLMFDWSNIWIELRRDPRLELQLTLRTCSFIFRECN